MACLISYLDTLSWLPRCIIGCNYYCALVGVYLVTKGRHVEDTVAKELEGKYGKRYSLTQQHTTADNGAKEQLATTPS